jgi:hypothetical protein
VDPIGHSTFKMSSKNKNIFTSFFLIC